MKLTRLIFLLAILILSKSSYGQDEFLYSSDGRTILKQRELIQNCLKNLNKTKTDQTALEICECQMSLLNRRFTYKQFRKYTSKGIIDVSKLIQEDSIVSQSIEDCYKSSGKIALLAAQANSAEFVKDCMQDKSEELKQ